MVEVGALPASAQQPDTVEADTTARKNTTAPQVEWKSPNRALLYSLGATAVPTAAGLFPEDGDAAVFMLLGIWLGPSAGHFYAGDSRQAWIGIGLRTVGEGVFLAGVASEVAESCLLCAGQSSTENGFDINATMIGGGLLAAGSALYDVVTAPGSAREYNEAHGLSAQMAPIVGPRGEQVGLAFRVTF